jgi:hypothetical protein
VKSITYITDTGIAETSSTSVDSLLGTAKLNGIDPESYLRNVLSRIASYPINRIEELLPWNSATSLSPEIDEGA